MLSLRADFASSRFGVHGSINRICGHTGAVFPDRGVRDPDRACAASKRGLPPPLAGLVQGTDGTLCLGDQCGWHDQGRMSCSRIATNDVCKTRVAYYSPSLSAVQGVIYVCLLKALPG
jgi:hypothetical protein